MNSEIYNKLFMGQEDCSKPVVAIIKQNEIYVAYNIKNPVIKHSFNSVKEFLSAIGSPATRPNCFDDLTGEDIFWGK